MLLQIAFERERAAARRLTRTEHLPPLAALCRVLEAIAAPASLNALISGRLQAQADLVHRRNERQLAAAGRHARKRAMRVPDPTAWHAWFDGSALPNPGHLGIGGVLIGPDGSVQHISQSAGTGDGNAAEYLALIAVLEAAVALQVQCMIVHGDSQVVLQDLDGRVPVRTGALRSYREHAMVLMQQIESVALVWIPRARNRAADALARSAIGNVERLNTSGN